MAMTFSNRVVAAVAGAAVAAVAAGLQALAVPGEPGGVRPPAGRLAVVQDATGGAAQAAAVRYWTPGRMDAALDGGGGTGGRGLRWTGAGAVAAAVGKVFFTLGGEDYVCSGALVGGEHPDVVLTAAHCVTSGVGGPKGGATQWATNWVFAPGFDDGLLPYGEYTARRFFVTPGWTGPATDREQYDAAFVQVTAGTLHGASGPWESGTARPPSGLPVAFAARQGAAPLGRAYVFGYPAEEPYSGLYLSYCAGPAAAAGGSLRTPCGMTAGDSGGPWLSRLSPRSGSGRVVAVSTYKVTGDSRLLYGAVLGPLARALYARALSSGR